MEPVLAILILAAGVVIFYGLSLRYRRRELQHKERLAALEKGAQLPDLMEEHSASSPRTYLLRGMVWLFAGVGLAAFLWAITVDSRRPATVEERLSRALNLRAMGANEAQIQTMMNDTTPLREAPQGLPLLGLVPIGVGLAYLIFYRAEVNNPLSRG